jgi:hypothetical protein
MSRLDIRFPHPHITSRPRRSGARPRLKVGCPQGATKRGKSSSFARFRGSKGRNGSKTVIHTVAKITEPKLNPIAEFCSPQIPAPHIAPSCFCFKFAGDALARRIYPINRGLKTNCRLNAIFPWSFTSQPACPERHSRRTLPGGVRAVLGKHLPPLDRFAGHARLPKG